MASRAADSGAESKAAARSVADAYAALLDSLKRAAGADPRARTALSGDARAVQGALDALLLRACAVAWLEESALSKSAMGGPARPTFLHDAHRSGRDGSASAGLVASALGEWRDWFADAGLDSLVFVEPSPWTPIEPSAFGAWADDPGAGAVLDAIFVDRTSGALRDPGQLYEELLALRVRRLEADSMRFRASGLLASARAVLAEPPQHRAKWLARTVDLPKSAVSTLTGPLATAATERAVTAALARLLDDSAQPLAGELVVEPSVARRRSGSHYTPDALCRMVLDRTLAPLIDGSTPSARAKNCRSLRVVDPAMGSGAFLVAAAMFLAENAAGNGGVGTADGAATLREIVAHCVFGVDKDPIATDLARFSLARLACGANRPLDLSKHLKCGDALVGAPERETSRLSGSTRFDWPEEFREIFSAERSGFDACVGNPPWVAYAGRAAQPLEPVLAAQYQLEYSAFRGYRTLHGLFVERAAELVREGGRIGLVLPTSVADLDGYAPARAAHDALADPDTALFDFGDGAFRGVFQPSMALTSTRRAGAPRAAAGAQWVLARSDAEEPALRLLARLDALPKLDAALFGERGFQSTGNDVSHLKRAAVAEPPFSLPIREGTDVSEFRAMPPRLFLNPDGLTGRFRSDADWRAVGVLIRQTARFPIAALADGTPFRNSILAGFSNRDWTAPALAAYLNSNVVRFYHYMRHRDARQGMPQLKIGHLRALPAVEHPHARARLDSMGRALGARNTGILPNERIELDDVVCDALGFDAPERAVLGRFSEAHPLPRPRASRHG